MEWWMNPSPMPSLKIKKMRAIRMRFLSKVLKREGSPKVYSKNVKTSSISHKAT